MNALADGPTDYDRLYEDCHARILRVCRLLLDEPNEAEDVAQEVFVKVLERSATGEQPRVWVAWLVRVAANACRDRRRSAWWKWWWGNVDEYSDEEHSSPETPEHRMASREQYLAIWNHFRALPARQREVFILRRLEGCSTQEVAGALGLSTGAVKRHLFRAAQRLQKAVREQL